MGHLGLQVRGWRLTPTACVGGTLLCAGSPGNLKPLTGGSCEWTTVNPHLDFTCDGTSGFASDQGPQVSLMEEPQASPAGIPWHGPQRLHKACLQ